MKKRMMGLFTILCLLLALSPALPAQGGKHPEIRQAMRAIEVAKDHLNHAAHDFGGHRVDAIRALDEAHHQLEICMQYDK
jgi:hypothetical protein